jgi:transposase
VVNRSRLSSADSALQEYLTSLPGSKHVALEAGCVWEHIYDAAAAVSATVTLVHPHKARLIAEASLKTDKVDAEALADLRRLNAVPTAFAPDAATRELRQLVRDRLYYKRQETATKNHTYAVLLRKGIPYEDGILGLKRRREELRSLHLPVVDRGLDMLAAIQGTCKGLDNEIEVAYHKSKEAQLLSTIPGIGKLSAVALVAELCPIGRFANVEKVCSYAGLVPTVHQSGETAYHGRLKQKDANLQLRSLLVEAAWVHRRRDPKSDVSKTGKRVARRRGKGKGSIAAARKLLKVVYAVLKRGTPYTPERPSCGQSATEP